MSCEGGNARRRAREGKAKGAWRERRQRRTKVYRMEKKKRRKNKKKKKNKKLSQLSPTSRAYINWGRRSYVLDKKDVVSTASGRKRRY